MKPLTALISALLLSAAQAAPLQVSATNTIIADFVKVVGGSRVNVNVLLPAGGDPHTFQPTPRDFASLSSSNVLFANGAGLESWLPKVKSAASNVKVVTLTQGLKLHQAAELDHDHAHDHGSADPHAWWDPQNAALYASKIASTLSALDPAGQASYAKNLAAYRKQLIDADTYAAKQFATLPLSKRVMVTNHDSQGYLAQRYGLNIVGNVIEGLSTEREPSAQELAKLITNIKRSGARAIFTENTVNARLAQTISQETGVKIAPPLYTDALGPRGSQGDSYLKAFRSNVQTIVKALQ